MGYSLSWIAVKGRTTEDLEPGWFQNSLTRWGTISGKSRRVGATLGTSYNPPVKCKLLSLKFQHDTSPPFFKTYIAPASCSDISAFFDGS